MIRFNLIGSWSRVPAIMRGRVPSRRTGPHTRPHTRANATDTTPTGRKLRTRTSVPPGHGGAVRDAQRSVNVAPQRGTPAANTAGVRRRVIEGEGLGGFARRLLSIPLLPGGSGIPHNFF